MSKVDLIISLPGHADLPPEFTATLAGAAADLKALGARVIVVNATSSKALDSLARIAGACEIVSCESAQGLGWIASCNRGLEIARRDGRDAVLLSPDALIALGALAEMAAVCATDPMIGFVAPRADATLCDALGTDTSFLPHDEAVRYLPRVTYLPVADAFCLYIRHIMTVEFGLPDESYGDSRLGICDFIMRCNRRGYRAVRANYAFVRGAAAARLRSGANGGADDAHAKQTFLQRYPEYDDAVARFCSSAEARAHHLVSGFVPDSQDRLRILFECSHLDTFHNGTTMVARELIARFCDRHSGRYACAISCSAEAYDFHGFGRVSGLVYAGDRAAAHAAAPYAAAIRLAQPLARRDLTNLGSLAPITGFLMLDTIALDCQNLDTQDLSPLWHAMLQTTAIVGYISEFSRDQFQRRFDVPARVTQVVTLLSTDVADYAPRVREKTSGAEEFRACSRPADGYILIVGSDYSHKGVKETVALLRAHEKRVPLVVFGSKMDDEEGLTSYRDGHFGEEFVADLYARARAVLFPSHYEGFGLPIMQALAHRKPLLCRRLPPAEEIRRRVREAENIHLFDATADMVRFALGELSWTANAVSSGQPVWSWADAADALEQAVTHARQVFRFGGLCDRLRYLGMAPVEKIEDELGRMTQARDHFEAELGRMTQGRDHFEAELGRMTQGRDRIQAELGGMTQARDHFEAELGRMTQGRDRIQAELGRMTQARDHFEAELGRMTQARDHFEAELGRMTQARDHLAAELGRAADVRDQYQITLERVTAEAERAKAGLDGMANSTNWRFTGPLRAASRMLRKARQLFRS